MVVPESSLMEGLLGDHDLQLEVANQLLKRSDLLVEVMVENLAEG